MPKLFFIDSILDQVGRTGTVPLLVIPPEDRPVCRKSSLFGAGPSYLSHCEKKPFSAPKKPSYLFVPKGNILVPLMRDDDDFLFEPLLGRRRRVRKRRAPAPAGMGIMCERLYAEIIAIRSRDKPAPKGPVDHLSFNLCVRLTLSLSSKVSHNSSVYR